MMYQCLLGDACHEDWFHDACVVGKGPVVYLTEGKDLEEKPDTKKDAETSAEAPETANIKTVEEEEDDDEDETRAESLGFPKDFEHTICWHCVEANPFLKRYAAYPGFFALARPGDEDSTAAEAEPELHSQGQKRKAEDDGADINGAKRILTEDNVEGTVDNPTNSTETTKSAVNTPRPCTLPELPSSLPKSFSLLLPSTFRTALCRCPSCFSFLSRHRVLLEHEETHQLPLSRSASPTGSIFEEGERALNGMDRVRAIEGVMAYNKLKDRIKAFLEPFAKSGKAVGVDDVKGYFEELKGEGKA